MIGIQLNIEHGHWGGLPPGHGVGVPISAVETFNSTVYGNVDSSEVREPTTLDEVFINNQRNVANISHIFNYDASGGTYSSNLIGASLPYSLFPSSTAVGDAVYFGSQTLTDSGPFNSVVLDIGTAAAATSFTILWRYWDGSVWANITFSDPARS